MLGKVLSAFIVVFWLCMMGLLVQREILPAVRDARQAALTPDYNILKSLTSEPRRSQMGIYLKDRRVGHTRSEVYRHDDEIRIESETDIKFNLGPAMMLVAGGAADPHMLFLFKARIFHGKLFDLRFTVHAPPGTPPLATIDAEPVGKKLHLKIRMGGEVRTEEIPFDAQDILSSDLASIPVLPKLSVGKRWLIKSFNPISYGVSTEWAEVVGKEQITVGDVEYDTFLITVPYAASRQLKVRIWATDDGEIVKQEMIGFTFLKEEFAADPD